MDVKSTNNSLVGIAIPAYRAAGTLEATLRSCVSQTLSNWVACVTVDGDDATAETLIAERIGDSRVHIEWNCGRLGQFANFNRAVLRCHAAGVRWIKPLCADDVLHSDALERMVALGESAPNCGLVYGFFNGIDAAGNLTSQFDLTHTRTRIWPRREFLLKALPLGNPLGGPTSVMFRDDVLEHCGLFSARLEWAGDSEMYYRIISRYDVGVLSGQPIADYRLHSNSVTGRLFATVLRFEQPMDVARATAALFAPMSAEWWAAQRAGARWGGILLLTALSAILRGRFAEGAKAAAAVIRRLSPLTMPLAAAHMLFRSARHLLGLRHSPVSELEPVIHECAAE
jgi:glycosyltransferase involved in cell wall biosynthesis